MREGEGDLAGAITLYMKAGLPGKAAKVISQHQVSSHSHTHVYTHTHTHTHVYTHAHAHTHTHTHIHTHTHTHTHTTQYIPQSNVQGHHTLSPQELSSQPDLLRHIASSLSQAGQHEKAGELYERAHDMQQAMEAYRKGGVYRRAVELARTAYPTQVKTALLICECESLSFVWTINSSCIHLNRAVLILQILLT